MTVDKYCSPYDGILDRFVIGSVLSVAAVAYYTTPYEVSDQSLGGACCVIRSVISCICSTLEAVRLKELRSYWKRGALYTLSATFPFCF